MTNTNNWQNYEGFVLAARDAGTAGKKLTFWTKEAGRIFIFAPQARRKANYIGYLVPTAFLRCTVAADTEGYRLLQADGRALTDTWQWTYPMWQVYYFLVHMTEELFASGQADAQVYHLWEQYLTALSRKDLAIATLIASWQLLGIAGYDPQTVLQEKQFLPLSDTGRQTLFAILHATWQDGPQLFSRQGLTEAADALLYYLTNYVEIATQFTNVFTFAQKGIDNKI